MVHSLHAYFLRPGDPTVPILYEVDRIRDGRSFTTRRVVAIQHGKAIFNLQASFHVPEPGPDHQLAMPSGLPDPESLPDFKTRMEPYKERMGEWYERPRPIDMRYIDGDPFTREGKPAHRPAGVAARRRRAARRPDPARLHRHLRQRHDPARHHRAAVRLVVGQPEPADGQPRPCDVVPSAVPRRRVAALRPDVVLHRRRARPGRRGDLHPRRPLGRHRRPRGPGHGRIHDERTRSLDGRTQSASSHSPHACESTTTPAAQRSRPRPRPPRSTTERRDRRRPTTGDDDRRSRRRRRQRRDGSDDDDRPTARPGRRRRRNSSSSPTSTERHRHGDASRRRPACSSPSGPARSCRRCATAPNRRHRARHQLAGHVRRRARPARPGLPPDRAAGLRRLHRHRRRQHAHRRVRRLATTARSIRRRGACRAGDRPAVRQPQRRAADVRTRRLPLHRDGRRRLGRRPGRGGH